MNPLIAAFNGNYIDAIELLLNNGSNPNIVHIVHHHYHDYILYTALSMDIRIVELLLSYGADPCIGRVDGTPFMRCNCHCPPYRNSPVKACEVYYGWGYGYTCDEVPIDLAVKKNDTDLTRLLIGYGATITPELRNIAYNNHNFSLFKSLSSDIDTSIPLSYFDHAIKSSWIDMIGYIMDICELDPNMEIDGTPILISAAMTHNTKIVDLFLSLGANPNITDESGKASIYYASTMGHIDVMYALIDHDVDIHTASLHNACRYGHIEVVRLLLSNGYDPSIPDILGRLPVHIATQYGHDSIVTLFEDYEPYKTIEEIEEIDMYPIYMDDDCCYTDAIDCLNTEYEPTYNVLLDKPFITRRLGAFWVDIIEEPVRLI